MSDSIAMPHSIKDRAASKYLKAFPTLSVCGEEGEHWSATRVLQTLTSLACDPDLDVRVSRLVMSVLVQFKRTFFLC